MSDDQPTEPDHAGDEPAASGYTRGRRILVNVLVGVTTLLLVLGMFSVWANRLLFNPDNWATTSTKLLQDPNVRSTTANYLVDQLYANVNVAGALKAGLPPRLAPLAGPAAGALRNASVQLADKALQTDAVQNLWAKANRTADQALITIVNGGKGPVTINQGVVTLNLQQILQNAASRVGLSGKLVAKLPPSAANLTVLKSKQLKFIQNVGNAIKGLALWLTIFVPLLYALAIALAPGHRRRTLLNIGVAVMLAGILVFFGRTIIVNQVPSSLTKDASLQATIGSVVSIVTQILSTVAGAVVLTGILLTAAALIAGPARWARAVRRWLAPFLREQPIPSYAIALGLLVLLFIWNPIPATGTPAGIIVFTVLGMLGTYLLSRQTAEEFPARLVPAASPAAAGKPAGG